MRCCCLEVSYELIAANVSITVLTQHHMFHYHLLLPSSSSIHNNLLTHVTAEYRLLATHMCMDYLGNILRTSMDLRH
jgi:hypothetical protein